METRKALGRGLEQLFNDNFGAEEIEQKIIEEATSEDIIEVNVDELRPNPYQPRKKFDDEALKDLAQSIKEYGVFQPIIVKKSIKGYYIVAGERRVRASKLAGLKTIPAIPRDFTDDQMMEIGLLENIQRENLNVMEEAEAYKAMLDNLHLTQDELSKKIGKSRSHITNIIGLLRLPKEVQEMVLKNELSMGHARVLSKLDSDEQIKEMAKKIVENKIPVRNLEEITNNDKVEKKVKIVKHKTNEYKYVEDMLRDKLDTKVKIKDKKIEISFTNNADLNRILEIIDMKEM